MIFQNKKRFYAVILSAFLGMFMFVTYYAVQQVQVYQSSAEDNSIGGLRKFIGPTSKPLPTQKKGIDVSTRYGGRLPGENPEESAGTAVVNLKLSFQGVTGLPLSGERTMDVKVTLASEDPTDVGITSTGTFLVDSSGIWTGQVSFPNAPRSVEYVLRVKGPKHLQKRICHQTTAEIKEHSTSGRYHCSGDGHLTIDPDKVNEFDFSAVVLPVGDLPTQDGLADSHDFSLVFSNFGTTDPATLAKADLNMDGKIDSQDYSLMLTTLEVKAQKADEY